MSDEETISLGLEAKALLDNPTFQKVFAHLSEVTLKEWRNTASGSVSLREQLFAQIHGLDAIDGRLKGWIEDAEYTAARIEKARERDELMAQRTRFGRAA